jgi:DNA-binding MarR family transcriptional regulator
MGELAKQLSCDNSNVTWITDRLEERGLVARTQAPYDRRVKLLVLTEEGRRLRGEIAERLADPPPPIARLSSSDQRTLRDILARAAEHIDAEA